MSTREQRKQQREQRRQARQAYAEAREELERIGQEDRAETDRWLRANRAVAEAEKRIPWWQRGW